MIEKKYSKCCKWIMLFLTISFLGWVMETVWCSFLAGQFWNRGFLHLPFCTIYGFGVLIIYYLLGTPQAGGLLLKKCPKGVLRWILYYLLSALIPTVVELAVGAFFDRVMGVELWTYVGYKLNLWGYVCLEVSAIWGFLATVLMAWGFMPLKRVVERIPNQVAFYMAVGVGGAICVDWVLCFAGIGR